ncbi:hypothetical protein GQR58_020532 [Nymphon striatum]|nr:hypothetical protein GQR58_020532 [Nymphon striatum]
MTYPFVRLSPNSCVAQDAVAITVLFENKGSKGSVQSVLNSLPKDKMFDVLKMHVDLIFKDKKFNEISSYGQVLAQNKPEVLARLLYHLSCKGILSLPEVICFIQHQSNEPTAGHLSVLQCLAEYMLFETSDLISEIDEASIVDTLVTIYVKNIIKEERQTSISSVMTSQFLKRYQWLNLLPPFSGKVEWKFCKDNAGPKSGCQCALCNCFLLKLQAFLCGSYAIPAVKLKIQSMLDIKMSGYLSIQLLCAENYNSALCLIQKNNQFSVLLQYGVEMFDYDVEKWSVLYNIVLDKRFETEENDDEYKILNYIILGILCHLSEHITPSNLVKFIPAGMDQSLYLSHLQKSCDKHQANKMKTKIVSMATELKQMM